MISTDEVKFNYAGMQLGESISYIISAQEYVFFGRLS